MTPSEKARELDDKFADLIQDGHGSRQCALLAVEEIINSKCEHCLDSEYWLQVKSEIEKL